MTDVEMKEMMEYARRLPPPSAEQVAASLRCVLPTIDASARPPLVNQITVLLSAGRFTDRLGLTLRASQSDGALCFTPFDAVVQDLTQRQVDKPEELPEGLRRDWSDMFTNCRTSDWSYMFTNCRTTVLIGTPGRTLHGLFGSRRELFEDENEGWPHPTDVKSFQGASVANLFELESRDGQSIPIWHRLWVITDTADKKHLLMYVPRKPLADVTTERCRTDALVFYLGKFGRELNYHSFLMWMVEASLLGESIPFWKRWDQFRELHDRVTQRRDHPGGYGYTKGQTDNETLVTLWESWRRMEGRDDPLWAKLTDGGEVSEQVMQSHAWLWHRPHTSDWAAPTVQAGPQGSALSEALNPPARIVEEHAEISAAFDELRKKKLEKVPLQKVLVAAKSHFDAHPDEREGHIDSPYASIFEHLTQWERDVESGTVHAPKYAERALRTAAVDAAALKADVDEVLIDLFPQARAKLDQGHLAVRARAMPGGADASDESHDESHERRLLRLLRKHTRSTVSNPPPGFDALHREVQQERSEEWKHVKAAAYRLWKVERHFDPYESPFARPTDLDRRCLAAQLGVRHSQ